MRKIGTSKRHRLATRQKPGLRPAARCPNGHLNFVHELPPSLKQRAESYVWNITCATCGSSFIAYEPLALFDVKAE
jgi:hypothetical protein